MEGLRFRFALFHAADALGIADVEGNVAFKECHDGAVVVDGVCQQVDQHLTQTQRVGNDDVLRDVLHTQGEGNAAHGGARADHAAQLLHLLREGNDAGVEHHPAAFDLGDIQNIVDQRQQVTARRGDLVQTVPHIASVVQMELGDLRHADDGVHRRADIVRHGGEEPRFCLVGALCHIDGAAQVLVDGENVRAVDEKEQEKRSAYQQHDALFHGLRLDLRGGNVAENVDA